ncbi:MAG: hypothetical protein E4G96_03010, partial [Chrysiogenales bacterium]
EDVLVRYLEYRGLRVERAIPLTDIEDKTIREAIKKNRSLEDLTGGIEKIFIREAKSLNIRLPERPQRTSQCIPTAVKLIERLIRTGHAYRHESDVFFDPLSFDGFGKLYRLDMKKWPKKRIRYRRDTYHGNRWNLGDFILWHGSREGDIKHWDTPIGRGRPSWNIQDPSVIIRHLGPQVDINCGGIDNIYRHHDYNIAIMESYTGKEYARCYLHGAHLLVDGKTMSKSRGNILYPEDIYASGCAALDLRFFLIRTHYRKKLNFTRDHFKNTCDEIRSFRELAGMLTRRVPGKKGKDPGVAKILRGLPREFESAMDDDLRVGDAFEAVRRQLLALAGLRERISSDDSVRLRLILESIDSVLGVIHT